MSKLRMRHSGFMHHLKQILENSMKRLVTLLSAAFLLILPLQAADLGGKVVQIGTDPTYPPHEYIDENTKQVVGFDVDVVVEI